MKRRSRVPSSATGRILEDDWHDIISSSVHVDKYSVRMEYHIEHDHYRNYGRLFVFERASHRRSAGYFAMQRKMGREGR